MASAQMKVMARQWLMRRPSTILRGCSLYKYNLRDPYKYNARMNEAGLAPYAAMSQRLLSSAGTRAIDDGPGPIPDTHFLTREEMEKLGWSPIPPGVPPGPGEYLHMRGRFTRRFFSKEVVPLYPLMFMVMFAIGLGLNTFYRDLRLHPNVLVDKKRRRQAVPPEVADPEWTYMQAREFHETSPYRKISGATQTYSPETVIRKLNRDVFFQPPRLPGDDRPHLVPPGSRRPHPGTPVLPDCVPVN